MRLERPWLTHFRRARGAAPGVPETRLFRIRRGVYNPIVMRVLLLRPDPGNERFGLGPFFRVEPLGLEYVGAALRERGHEPVIVDLRFGHSVRTWVRRTGPAVVGISCMHALEYDQVLADAREVRS